MKTLKVVIELEVKGDENDPDTLKEDIYERLQELMEEDDLPFEVVPSEDDEDDEEMDF